MGNNDQAKPLAKTDSLEVQIALYDMETLCDQIGGKCHAEALSALIAPYTERKFSAARSVAASLLVKHKKTPDILPCETAEQTYRREAFSALSGALIAKSDPIALRSQLAAIEQEAKTDAIEHPNKFKALIENIANAYDGYLAGGSKKETVQTPEKSFVGKIKPRGIKPADVDINAFIKGDDFGPTPSM